LLAAPAAQPGAAAEAPAFDQSLELVPEATPAAEAAAGAEGAPEDNFLAQGESAVPTGTSQPEALKYRADEEATAEPGREAELQASAEQDGDTVSEQPAAAEPQELTTTREASSRGSPLLRGAEIGLGATAIVLGVLTVRARRRQS
jgi:hypothetical protein